MRRWAVRLANALLVAGVVVSLFLLFDMALHVRGNQDRLERIDAQVVNSMRIDLVGPTVIDIVPHNASYNGRKAVVLFEVRVVWPSGAVTTKELEVVSTTTDGKTVMTYEVGPDLTLESVGIGKYFTYEEVK